MSESDYVGHLKGLKGLCAKVKAELLILYRAARDIAVRTIIFILNRPHLIAALILGSIICYLLTALVPWIGGFLGLMALITFAAIGLMYELKKELVEQFS